VDFEVMQLKIEYHSLLIMNLQKK